MEQFIEIEEVNKYINACANNFSIWRKMRDFDNLLNYIKNEPSSSIEMDKDWNQACAYLVNEIISGLRNFSYFSPDSYSFFESIWLKDIKLHIAYSNYLNNTTNSEEQNYYFACDKLREYLFDLPTLPLDYFEIVRKYLNDHYLINDRVSMTKPGSESMIAKKAARIYENIGINDPENIKKARIYINLFYDNIVRAVLKNDKKAISRVVQAFQFCNSQQHPIEIINSFEAIVAISFLNKETLNSIINEDELFNITLISHNNWPSNKLKEFKKLKYLKMEGIILQHGKMQNSDKNKLIELLDDHELKSIVEKLYKMSQLIPKERIVF